MTHQHSALVQIDQDRAGRYVSEADGALHVPCCRTKGISSTSAATALLEKVSTASAEFTVVYDLALLLLLCERRKGLTGRGSGRVERISV